MKRQYPHPHRLRSWATASKGLLLLGALACVTFVLAQLASDQELLDHTPLGLPLDKVGRLAEDDDPATLKWGRVAMHDPMLAIQLRDSRKTAEQKAVEELAALAMLEPEKYRQQKEGSRKAPKSKEKQAAEDQDQRDKELAALVILKPREFAQELEKTKGPAQRKREQSAEQAILFPREFNAQVERHKSPELRQKEAEAIDAFNQPKAFLEEKVRLKKTGSSRPQKPSASESKAKGGSQ